MQNDFVKRSLKEKITGTNKMTLDDSFFALIEKIVRQDERICAIEIDRDARSINATRRATAMPLAYTLFTVAPSTPRPSEDFPWIFWIGLVCLSILAAVQIFGNRRNPEWRKDKFCLALEALVGTCATLVCCVFTAGWFTSGDNRLLWVVAGSVAFCSAVVIPLERWRRQPSAWQIHIDAGRAAAEQGRWEEAETHFRSATQIAERFPVEDRRLGISLCELGGTLTSRQSFPEAKTALLQAKEAFQKIRGLSDLTFAAIQFNLGVASHMEGTLQEAEEQYKTGLYILGATRPGLGGALDPRAGLLGNLSLIYIHQKRFAEAEPLARREWEIRKEAGQPAEPFTRRALQKWATCCERQGKHDEAEELCRQLMAIEQEAFGEGHTELEGTYQLLAEICTSLGKTDGAQSATMKATAIREAREGANGPASPA